MSFICLYHRCERTDATTEDILQKAFGGKKISKDLICKACNNKLGSTIDKEHAESLDWITSMINPIGRRKPAQKLKNVVDENGDRWNIDPGGRPTVPYQSIGENTWKADISQIELAKKNALAKAKATGIEDPVINIQQYSTKAAAIKQSVLFDNTVTFRAACKAALEALALLYFSDDDKRSDLLLNARDFIMHGTEYNSVGWLVNSIRPNLFLEGLDHSILLVQSPDLSIYWEYILYGGIVAVSGRFSSINKKVNNWLYVVSPTSGERTELEPNLFVVKEYVSWSPDTTPELQNRLELLLDYKINIHINTNTIVEECLAGISNDRFDSFEQIEVAVDSIIDRYSKVMAELYGFDSKQVKQYLRTQIKLANFLDSQ